MRQPGFALGRDFESVTASPVDLTNVTRTPGIGLYLTPLNYDLSDLHSATAEMAGTVPTGHDTIFTIRQDVLPGVSYGSGLTQSGAMHAKRVAVGGSYADRLTADEAAFAGPAEGLAADMDRIYVSDNTHYPEDAVSFSVYAPGGPLSTLDGICRLYFTGVASDANGFNGNGAMMLEVRGSGFCTLYEWGLDNLDLPAWKARDMWTIKTAPGIMHRFVMETDCRETDDGWEGASVAITAIGQNGSPDTRRSLIPLLITAAVDAIGHDVFTTKHVYRVPRESRKMTTPNLVRIDARRDLRVVHQAYEGRYKEEGTAVDQKIQLPFFPAAGGTLRCDILCYRPDTTTVAASLINAETGAAITGTVVLDDDLGISIDFTLPAGTITTSNSRRYYQLTLTLTSNATQTKTPVVTSVSFFLPELRETIGNELIDFPVRATAGSGPHLLKRAVQRTSISGDGDDPATAAAAITLADLTGEALQIRDKAGTPVDIDILDDAGTIVTRLFRGEVARVEANNIKGVVKSGSTDPYPGLLAWRGVIPCNGAWTRLTRQLSQGRLQLVNDSAPGTPYKVTDGIRKLFNACGAPNSELDIPDLDVTFLNDPDDPVTIEPDAKLTDIIVQINRDYIGGLIVRDENASQTPATPNTEGLFRLLTRPKAPFRPLLRFTTVHPGSLKLPHVLAAYPVDVAGDDQEIQHVPVWNATKTVTPPEANVVCVIGGLSGGSERSRQLVQIAVNVRSYNALGLSSGHAKYPSAYDPDTLFDYTPIVVRDATLSSPEAVNWVCRRTFEAACYSYTTRTFTAPMPFITDVADTLQTRPRMPRIGDIVEYREEDGVFRKYAIVRCDPDWKYAHKMEARFTIVRSRTIDSYNFVNPAVTLDYAKSLQRLAMRTMERIGLQSGWTMAWEQNRTVSTGKGEWASLPVQTMEIIQDLDPASSTFGDFIGPAGYE